jgi:hypothetical protein
MDQAEGSIPTQTHDEVFMRIDMTNLAPKAIALTLTAVAVFALSPGQFAEQSSPSPLTSALPSQNPTDSISPVHQKMIANLSNRNTIAQGPAALCFEELPRWEVRQAFDQAIMGGDGFNQFQLTSRWSSTTTSGGGLGQGDPTIITYSFVPDGTLISSGVGEPPGVSNLFAVFDAQFGTTAAWQNKIHQVFANWSLQTGITYLHETNDDGVSMFVFAGAVGVRGDVRIGAKSIDGTSSPNILAYNMFPNDGDMVLDADDISYFGNSSADFRRLRNVVAHEAGHGIGLLHVCPLFTFPGTLQKIMEPKAVTNFDGPQHDDILAANRHYGDRFENNNSTGAATDLGAINNGTTTVNDVGIDDNSDDDYYKFTVADLKKLSATLRPIGFTYLQGPQTPSCDTGTSFNSLAVQNLEFDVRDTDGSTILASVDATPAGQNEVATDLDFPSGPGTYYLRVGSGSVDNAQLYELDLTITSAPDCNGNWVSDSLDISLGSSSDDNGNTIPDECDPYGDTDNDGDVDGVDFAQFASCFNKAGNPPRTLGCPPPHDTDLDFDNDGDIDGIDFSHFASCFNKAGNPPRCGP